MPKLHNIYQYEPGSGDIVPPKSGIVKPEIIRSLDMPFASRTSPGTGKIQRGMLTRCTEHGATLAKRREVLTLVDTTDFLLPNWNPLQGFVQEPQIDAFSFRYTLVGAGNRAGWQFSAVTPVLYWMDDDTDYFQPVMAKMLWFGMDNILGDSMNCQLKTYRYE